MNDEPEHKAAVMRSGATRAPATSSANAAQITRCMPWTTASPGGRRPRTLRHPLEPPETGPKRRTYPTRGAARRRRWGRRPTTNESAAITASASAARIDCPRW
jgi:hypothetical protein